MCPPALTVELCRPNAPHLSLELDASLNLSLTVPFNIYWTLRYRAPSGDAEDKSIVLQWNPYQSVTSNNQLILLRETGHGFEKLETERPSSTTYWNDETIRKFSKFIEFTPSNTAHTWNHSVPASYHKSLKVNEKYAILWPGGEIKWWDWGTVVDHEGTVIRAEETSHDSRPRIILPASNLIKFTAVEEQDIWPRRTEVEKKFPIQMVNILEKRWRQQRELARPKPPLPRVLETERITGAPVLAVSLTGSQTVACKRGGSSLSVIFTYHGADSSLGRDERPITFRLDDILSSHTSPSAFSVLHHSSQGLKSLQEWRPVIDPLDSVPIRFRSDFSFGRRLGLNSEAGTDLKKGTTEGQPEMVETEIEYLQRKISVRESDGFQTLLPGESFTHTSSHLSQVSFETVDRIPVYNIGERYTYRFNGGEISWWDWGTKEDHRETMIGKKETSHDKRPKIILPASNDFEYVIVESVQNLAKISNTLVVK